MKFALPSTKSWVLDNVQYCAPSTADVCQIDGLVSPPKTMALVTVLARLFILGGA